MINQMIDNGVDPGCNELVEGILQRFDLPGSKPKSRAGWYVFFGTGGVYGSWKTMQKWTFSYKNRKKFTPEEKRAWRENLAKAEQQRIEAEKIVHAECKVKSQKQWNEAGPASDKHPYLVKKNVKAHGLKQDGNLLLVPVSDVKGAADLAGLQTINPTGTKLFKTGTPKSGKFHVIGKPIDNTVIVCEGYATGATIHEATGHMVLVAFDAGNLKPVAEYIRAKKADWRIILAADDDRWNKINTGKTKAQEAAQAVRGEIVYPHFRDVTCKPTDFNDLASMDGLAAVKACIYSAYETVGAPDCLVDSGVLAQNIDNLPVYSIADKFSDMRMATAFAQTFSGVIRYWPDTAKWLVFDGRRWTTDAPGGAFGFFRDMIVLLYKNALDSPDYAQRAELMKAIHKLEAQPRQETILAAARTRPELIVTANQLDQNPMLLTVNNGTIDLTSGGLKSHNASDFITRMSSIEFIPGADCKQFLGFLERIFAGNNEIIEYLQRFVGYCLTGQTSEQILLFFYGLGCNGKSVLANILRAVLGCLASSACSDLLMARDNRGASNDVAALRGARLVTVSEFDDGERLAESQIKTLTGGDPVTCRMLYQDFFTYTPTYKILLIGNHRPKVRGTDHGIWRRLHLLNFNVTIPENERDPHLQDKLLSELPGILAWAVRGCLEWQRIGLSPPDEVRAAVAEYRGSEDVFSQWIDEYCVTGKQFATPAPDLLASFIDYSKWKGTTLQKMGRMLAEAGFKKEKSSVIRWRGLGLKQTGNNHWQDKDDYEDFSKPF